MIVGLALLAGGLLPAAEPEALVGEGTYYAAGLMQEVEAARVAWGHVARCDECEGGVALLECRHLGRRVWIVHPASGEVVGPYLVVDCARRADAPALRARGWVVDLPYELARRWGMSGPLRGVEVLFADPALETGKHKDTTTPGNPTKDPVSSCLCVKTPLPSPNGPAGAPAAGGGR